MKRNNSSSFPNHQILPWPITHPSGLLVGIIDPSEPKKSTAECHRSVEMDVRQACVDEG